MTFEQWAARWRLPPLAVDELRTVLMAPTVTAHAEAPEGSETAAQQLIRLEASKLGMGRWRNNTGACMDDTGRLIRYGLANDSQRVSKSIKSSDLIGITPHVVTSADVGRTLGVFTSIEVKRPGWTFRGQERETAQLAWINLVQVMGGRAMFATGPADLVRL